LFMKRGLLDDLYSATPAAHLQRLSIHFVEIGSANARD